MPPLTAEQFARAAGLEPEQLADCVQFGLLATDADGRHPAATCRSPAPPRGWPGTASSRGTCGSTAAASSGRPGLVEQLVAPVLRARSEEARTRATEKLRELATLSAQLHTALLEARLRELLRP